MQKCSKADQFDSPKRMLLEIYELLLDPNTDTPVVKDSFVYQWIIER